MFFFYKLGFEELHRKNLASGKTNCKIQWSKYRTVSKEKLPFVRSI